MVDDIPREPNHSLHLAGIFSLLVAGTGLIALLGWGLQLPFLTGFGAGRIPMASEHGASVRPVRDRVVPPPGRDVEPSGRTGLAVVSVISAARWSPCCCSSCRSSGYIRRSNISVSRSPERWAERRSATCHRWRRSASSSPAFPSSHCLQWPRNGRGEPRWRCISHRCWLPYPSCSSWRISSGPLCFPREPLSRLRSTPVSPSFFSGSRCFVLPCRIPGSFAGRRSRSRVPNIFSSSFFSSLRRASSPRATSTN